MKAPIVLGSLLALAGTAATAESADAAISDVADIQGELTQAVCTKDWYRAIEVSGKLITSSKITPDYRQQLLGLRRQFYTHAQGGTKADDLPRCAEFKASLGNTPTLAYEGPEPRFSNKTVTDTAKTTTPLPSLSVTSLANIWTVGVRVEGNNIRGTVLNNGLTPANNVTLTIRSQQEDNSEDIKTIAIDTVRPWDEADFVAAFNDAPGSWMIESIEVN